MAVILLALLSWLIYRRRRKARRLQGSNALPTPAATQPQPQQQAEKDAVGNYGHGNTPDPVANTPSHARQYELQGSPPAELGE